MAKVLRSVLAIVAGFVLGFVVVGCIESVGHILYPPPSGIDFSKPGSIAEAMKAMPTAAFVPIVLAWALGAFAGSWAAARIAAVGKLGHGMIIGGLFLAAGVANMVMIPHPGWVWAIGLIEPLPMAYLGAWLASGSRGSKVPSWGVA